MKKSLLALAVAGAFSGAAFAQSSVTLFGVADTGYSYYKGDGNGNQIVLTNSNLNSSRLGVRGTEDLGGGLKANFWFEAGVATDNGSGAATNTNNQTSGGNSAAAGAQGLTFNRRMTVGLSGDTWGEFRLGRDYTPLFWQITNNDPFGTNGSGDTKIYALTGLTGAGLITTTVRASNAVQYFTPPNIGGVYVHAMYARGENASNSGTATLGTSDGNYVSGRVGWAGFGADVSVVYAKSSMLQLLTQGSYTGMDFAVNYTFGNCPTTCFKPMFQIAKHKIDINNAVNPDPERTDWLLGIVASFGATDIRASYNNYDIKHPAGAVNGAHQLALGPVYNLSRRTAVYGTVSQMDNKTNGTAFSNGRATITPGGKTTAFDLGLRHSF